MRIAQVAPLFERVPPKNYGGTERTVSYLTEELVRMGHEVTLYASGDSLTSAELVGVGDASLREAGRVGEATIHHFLQLERLFRNAYRYDVIHFHNDYLHFPFTRRERPVALTTLHGRLDIPELVPLYGEYAEMTVNSISHSQRAALPWLRWLGNVYHGLPTDLYRYHPQSEGYLAFLGRVSPEKGLDRAIHIANQLGRRLRIAAKVDAADRKYHEEVIAPLLAAHPNCEFIGEINDEQKNDFLGGADALLFPINWPEPFGLVMIEAMACGTPVVAFAGGSVSEVIDDGISGFVVRSVAEAIEAVRRVDDLPRQRCRETFEERFSVNRMARDYVELYERLIDEARRPRAQEARVANARGKRGRAYNANDIRSV